MSTVCWPCLGWAPFTCTHMFSQQLLQPCGTGTSSILLLQLELVKQREVAQGAEVTLTRGGVCVGTRAPDCAP
jgi:hypothetical protein